MGHTCPGVGRAAGNAHGEGRGGGGGRRRGEPAQWVIAQQLPEIIVIILLVTPASSPAPAPSPPSRALVAATVAAASFLLLSLSLALVRIALRVVVAILIAIRQLLLPVLRVAIVLLLEIGATRITERIFLFSSLALLLPSCPCSPPAGGNTAASVLSLDLPEEGEHELIVTEA